MTFPAFDFPKAPLAASGIAVRNGDQIELVLQSSNSTAIPCLGHVNYYDPSLGRASDYQVQGTSSTDRSLKSNVQSTTLPDGFITSGSIQVTTPSNLPKSPGILWGSLNLLRGGINIGTLCSGYIWAGGNLNFGKIVWNADRSSPGRLYNVRTSGALAAAGVGIGFPAKSTWRIFHISVKLATSATAGTRTILVYMTDGTAAPSSGVAGTNDIIEWVNSGTFGTGRNVVANTTERYEITSLQTVDTSANIIKILNSPIYFSSGTGGTNIFIQDTAAIDAAGDTVTVDAFVEEWFAG